MGLKTKMAARIVFVDEQTIDEVYGGEDSDRDLNTCYSESREEEGDVSEEESDVDDESEEEEEADNMVVGSREPARLDFTADQGLDAELPDDPSFLDYFHLLFPENLFEEMARQTNKYARELLGKGIVCHKTRDSEVGLRMA